MAQGAGEASGLGEARSQAYVEPVLRGGDDGGVGEAAATQNTPALTLGGTAPDAMIDVVRERVLEARL
jgi:hypothetical protein